MSITIINFDYAVEALYEARTERGIMWEQPSAFSSHRGLPVRPT